MKAIHTDTNGVLRGHPMVDTALKALFLASLILVLNLGGAALAQDSEIGNVDRYAPSKTISDYEAGADPGDSDFDYNKIDLRVSVWLDREENEIYQRGEEMGAAFQANQDAYAVVYRIDIDGRVTVLWPRGRMDDGFVFGGHEYLLPVSGARKLRVATSEGEGYVEAIVSKYPFDLRDLEIDFHHESDVDKFDFRVAGDPFLAMNEVNFAVTGLENSEDYVVTNYASYFVHREVDHPRYLCSQCHFEDDVAYDPYRDTCTIEITYDYGWVNRWYSDYGYYPVYANPVYVYVDPWTWRPWVNFWYWPSYTCAPYYGYGWYGGACWSWGYSPYYAGSCYTNYNSGYSRYRPLTQGGGSGVASKTREYGGVSRMVGSDTPDSRQRDAMANRTRLSDRDGIKGRSTNLATTGSRAGGAGNVKATPRQQPRFDEGVRVRGNAGLRIRDGGSTVSRTRSGDGRPAGTEFRHRAGGSGTRSSLVPVNRGSGGGAVSVRGGGSSRTGGAVQERKTGTASGSGSSNRAVKPTEPRNRGTRVWNSGRGSQSGGRYDRTRQVRPGSSRQGSSPSGKGTRSSGSVKPRSGGTTRSSGAVKPKSGSSRSKSSSSRGSGSVGNRSSGKSSSGGGRSSGGGSRSSGGSRSGGGSKSGGRGGGTSHRR